MTAVRGATPICWLALATLALFARPAAGQRLHVEAIGALVEHRVTTGQAPERVVGTAVGVGIVAPLLSWLEMRGRLIGGGLAAQTPATDDRRFGEMEATASVTPLPWLAFDVGTLLRSYTNALARQRWFAMRVGSELRISFGDGRVLGTLNGALMPLVNVSGIESPSISLSSGAGLVYRHGTLHAGLVYRLERHDFPPTGTARRLEQVSSIAAAVGIAVR
ncbi:MAG TPA: hypothetical protein VMM18_13900 [Gemmatimonadaceae bacterium]|nr:hypothetical protein [Gemmatimonadaceae bacterium]